MLSTYLRHPFIRMCLVAGVGWLLDAMVYLGIANATGQVFTANMIGNCCGIAFSFIVGARHAFDYRGVFLYKKFTLYVAFAFSMMPLFSGLLSWLVHAGWFGLVGAKIVVTLPSFVANYLFMKRLLHV